MLEVTTNLLKLQQISWCWLIFLLEFNTASIFNLQVSKTFFGTSLAANFVPAHLWFRFFHSFETGIARAIFPLNYLATQLTLVLLGPYIYVFQDRFKPHKMTLKMIKIDHDKHFSSFKARNCGKLFMLLCWTCCMLMHGDLTWHQMTLTYLIDTLYFRFNHHTF